MNMTLGQFYPSDSVIHRLDPRFKIIATIIFTMDVFLVRSFVGYLFIAFVLGILMKISKIPFKLFIKTLKGIMFLILFTMVVNLLFTPGEIVIFKLGFLKITQEAAIFTLKITVRIILFIIGTSILTLTTSPIDLTDGIEQLLKPFKKIGVPSHEIAMIMGIALRFIPILMEEIEKIKKAQIARGADFETGSIIKRGKAMIPLLVPLFISAFRRADELALAMEARCYRGDVNRTRMKQLKYVSRDYIAFFAVLLFTLAVIAERWCMS